MCNLIFTLHQHCSHEQYQNTFPCHVVRGCEPYDPMVLSKTVFLFDTKKNPKLFADSPCKKLKLRRPAQSLCDVCKKKLQNSRRDKDKDQGKAKQVLGLSSSVSSPAMTASPSGPFVAESSSSPDVDLESAQNTTIVSLLRMSQLPPGLDDSPTDTSRTDYSCDASPLANRERQRLSEIWRQHLLSRETLMK